MSVISIDKNFDNLSLDLVAEFDAPVERVWQLWADPRLLERWWGPPTYPATFEDHDLTPGGEVTYFMTGPDGEKSRGWWQVTSVEAPNSLDFTDGFADPDGAKAVDMPITSVQMRLREHEGGTRMELHSIFDSQEQMEQLMTMGMSEGLQQSVAQMDALLAA
jgi:uncharacterized protein YndB with AHSA1/START domain